MSMLRLEAVEPSFRPRVYVAGQGSFETFNLIVIVRRGAAQLLMGERDITIGRHCVMVLPHGAQARLQVPAGTGVWIIGFARRMQSLITGTGPESLSLDLVLSRPSLTPENPQIVETSILPLLPLLVQELNDPGKRSQTAIAALLRLLLIATSRMFTADSLTDVKNDIRILHRFRQLVELDYRNRKSVAEYCQDLNLTYDRLHDICQRNLKRSPLALIHQRILLDASTRLAQSDDSIQSIADHLGFNDPTKFSHFFKRSTGLSPRQYRQMTRQEMDLQASSALRTFSDWP
ncbi:AraC family transcriptional regulator [Thalassovita sp.]|uniref:helix-turn-helix domain-containing protein n=1 Tax=Thalassovita sp. TaxID=1979401 RepID=UPI002B26D45A|nr:AraC family transcriptional regulator [Thalassovita sp.]